VLPALDGYWLRITGAAIMLAAAGNGSPKQIAAIK
jgi:hypothetical protein